MHLYRPAAGESADDSLHPRGDTAPYLGHPASSLSSPSLSPYPFYPQLPLSYEQEFPAYEVKGGPYAADSAVIGANLLSDADFNSSLPIPDPLAVLRDSSSAELKAIYSQFRPILDDEEQQQPAVAVAPPPVVVKVETVAERLGDYGYTSAFQSVPISYLRREVTVVKRLTPERKRVADFREKFTEYAFWPRSSKSVGIFSISFFVSEKMHFFDFRFINSVQLFSNNFCQF